MISKHGSEEDKRNLPTKSKYNSTRQTKKRSHSLKEFTHTPRRINRNTRSIENANLVVANNQNDIHDQSIIPANNTNSESKTSIENITITEKETNAENANGTTKEKSLVVLKRMGSGVLESKSCFYCQKMPSNHYCLAEVKNSNVVAEGDENKPICGRNACILCRSAWGAAEDFANICINHKLK